MTRAAATSHVGSEVWYLLYEVQMAVYRGLTGRLGAKHVNSVASFTLMIEERQTLGLPDDAELHFSSAETAQQALTRVIRNSTLVPGWSVPLVAALTHLRNLTPLDSTEEDLLLQLADAIDRSLY